MVVRFDIGVCDLIEWDSPDIGMRFTESSLLIAINFLVERHVQKFECVPQKFVLYISPLYSFIAKAVLNKPQFLQTLDHIDSGVLSNEIVVCSNIESSGSNASWALVALPGNEIIVSAGTTPPYAAPESEVKYNR